MEYTDLVVAQGSGTTMVAYMEEIENEAFFTQEERIRFISKSGAVTELDNRCPSDDTGLYDTGDVGIAWNGSAFLVAIACDQASGIKVLTVNAGGTVTPHPTLAQSKSVTRLHAASAGGGFAVVESVDGSGGSDIVARRLSASGAAVGAAATVAGGAAYQAEPAIAGSGGNYLIAWSQGDPASQVLTRTLSASGTLGAAHQITGHDFGTTADTPSVTGRTTDGWVIAWHRTYDNGSNPPTQDIYGSVVESTGIGNLGGRVFAGGARVQSAPSLSTAAGGSVALAYLDAVDDETVPRPLSQAIDSSGAPSGSPVPAAHEVQYPERGCNDAAGGNGQFLVTWQEIRQPNNPNLYAQRYDAAGNAVGSPITISTAIGDQFCPVAAWSGTNWLVVWTDARSGVSDIYATTVSGSGAVTPAGGFAITRAAGVQQGPDVSFDGTHFVVAWNDQRNGNQDIYAARVTTNRTVLDPQGIPVTTAQGAQKTPAVASSNGVTLISWRTNGVQRRLLRSNGTFIGSVVTQAAEVYPEHGAVAASGTTFAMLYSRTDTGPELSVLDAATGATIRRTTTDTSGLYWSGGDLTFDGGRFVMVQDLLDEDTFSDQVSVRTVSIDGLELGSPTLLSGVTFRQPRLAALPTGQALAAAIPEGRELSTVSIT
ncbi:MAG: hypothetical protein JO291_11140 [Acidimicrobiia bacterium]|nr:hypothetical protein [Acidimicrobiia bacterium]